jgi:hypothetical protein
MSNTYSPSPERETKRKKKKCFRQKKNRKKNVLVYGRPEDEAISMFAGLLANPDVPLSLPNIVVYFSDDVSSWDWCI